VANLTETVSLEDRLVSARSLRVLVVEDSLDAADALAIQLRQWGYEYRICTSGGEALALAPYFHPNVVLIDIGLPDMTGWELARLLPRDALLIAVTARGEDGDYWRSRYAGIRYHLVKPAYQRQLREVLERVGPASP
jgi:DNA-binding response OmpR family regulator